MFALSAFILFPLVSCSGGTTRPELSAEEGIRSEIIASFVAKLFPIEGVNTSSFTAIAQALLKNPDLSGPIEMAVQGLNDAANGDWLGADDAAQIQIMKTLELQPWFVTLFITSRALLFDRSDVWSVLDYEGPSIEFGGYKYKGFDDIDWLPKGNL